jgi:hypothetical protein
MKLNDDDHSEDEGIEDYVIEGYSVWHSATTPATSARCS